MAHDNCLCWFQHKFPEAFVGAPRQSNSSSEIIACRVPKGTASISFLRSSWDHCPPCYRQIASKPLWVQLHNHCAAENRGASITESEMCCPQTATLGLTLHSPRICFSITRFSPSAQPKYQNSVSVVSSYPTVISTWILRQYLYNPWAYHQDAGWTAYWSQGVRSISHRPSDACSEHDKDSADITVWDRGCVAWQGFCWYHPVGQGVGTQGVWQSIELTQLAIWRSTDLCSPPLPFVFEDVYVEQSNRS